MPDPESVDAEVDEQLKYTFGTTAEVLKAYKFWFGTEFASKSPEEQYALLWGDDESDESEEESEDELGNDWWSNQPDEEEEDDSDNDQQTGGDTDKETFIKALTGAGWSQQQAETKWEAFRLNQSVARGVADALLDRMSGMLSRLARPILRQFASRRPPRLPPKGTPERAKIEAARNRGRDRKKAEELANIRAGGKGSGVWSKRELDEIRRTGEFPDDVRWHHDPTVANRPDLADNPKAVHPVRGGNKGHLDKHDGDWRNPRE